MLAASSQGVVSLWKTEMPARQTWVLQLQFYDMRTILGGYPALTQFVDQTST